ncbi:ATP-dependent DNA helicase [Yasminevirus sp. GU-2018]|uniref:ATP-dependent DNA helicase n=1 Tax=Yasminevirus sp. GU-2018 TaxID=2420051 RepID=A0A5K0U7J5_9VIRU|nr:ATP-dependent DNA helicase [Yasminevirus sp. GU-2018]
MSYTEEQLKYINFKKKTHTKLLACAGSGKTRCIIARMSFVIEKKMYPADSILMLTFSRFTRDDFINRIKTCNVTCIPTSSISTIDKFAKLIIDPKGTVDVSLLSYNLAKYLEEESKAVLKKNDILKKIKAIFIDEAQDLNEIQYRILCALRDKLGVHINMVGDPNQNIYQFRESSDKFLTQFEGEVFVLTHNFRSHLPIIEFSKHLRPFDEYDVVCTKGDNNCKPIIMLYEDEKILEEEILDMLHTAQEQGIDLSEFAILAPTRGRMRGCGNSHGLCFISNILYKAKIKFKQFYEESTEEISGDGIKYEPEKGHVNVLSYMGSKGLEWNYVIIVDPDLCLINKRSFDEEKHNNDRYLLYVVCSRAVHNMVILSKCSYRQGDYHFNTNPWFRNVPEEAYALDNRFSKIFFFPKPTYKNMIERENRVSKIVDKLNCQDLDEMSTILDFQNRKVSVRHQIFNKEYTGIEKSSAIFLTKYVESFFQAIYNIKMNRAHVAFPDIENIIEGDNVVTNVADEVADWYAKNKKTMTWEKFDTMRNIDPFIKETINRAFNRNETFNSHIISPNGYYQTFILGQKMWIKNIYKKYLKCKNTTQIRELLFYLVVIKHSMDTQHYFHIKSKGKKYEHILTDFKEMLDEIEYYVDDIEYNFVTSHKNVERWGLVSRIDLVDDEDKNWYVKCSNDISLKHTIHAVVAHLMNDTHLIDDGFELIDPINNGVVKVDSDEEEDDCDRSVKLDEEAVDIKVNFINFMKGEEITYKYTLTTTQIRRLIGILTDNTINNPIKNMDKVAEADQAVDDIVAVMNDE